MHIDHGRSHERWHAAQSDEHRNKPKRHEGARTNLMMMSVGWSHELLRLRLARGGGCHQHVIELLLGEFVLRQSIEHHRLDGFAKLRV